MIYGATGYTGRLVAAEATKSGVRPVLAGRSGERLRSVAGPLGLETRAVSLDTADLLAAALEDITVVLHCAGPFSRTALPMFEACLTAGAHYLDITGEVAVCEALAARDTAAREAGIMALPGAGFDVVPSDCLIADLAARCPGGRVVRLGVATRSGASRGTMRTILESVNNFRIRKGGAIERVAPGSLRHDFDFGEGPRTALVTVLADVSTAYRSTGIGNIETYGQAGRRFQAMTRLSRRCGWLLAGRIPQMVLSTLVDRRPEGPGEIRAPECVRNPGCRNRGCDRRTRRRAVAHPGSVRPHGEDGGGHCSAGASRRCQGRLPDTVVSVRRGLHTAVRRGEVGVAGGVGHRGLRAPA